MIALSLELTRVRVGDYWDDADRWVRNQFAENQLTPEKCAQMADLSQRLLPFLSRLEFLTSPFGTATCWCDPSDFAMERPQQKYVHEFVLKQSHEVHNEMVD
jgi:hypothetical protein